MGSEQVVKLEDWLFIANPGVIDKIVYKLQSVQLVSGIFGEIFPGWPV